MPLGTQPVPHRSDERSVAGLDNIVGRLQVPSGSVDETAIWHSVIAMARPDSISHESSIRIVVDRARKTVRMNFVGHVTAIDMHGQIGTTEAAVNALGAGFTLVSDMTELEAMDLECVPHITRVMDLCLKAGIGKALRIIPDPDKDIGMNLLSIVHYRGKVPTVTVESRAEAEKELR